MPSPGAASTAAGGQRARHGGLHRDAIEAGHGRLEVRERHRAVAVRVAGGACRARLYVVDDGGGVRIVDRAVAVDIAGHEHADARRSLRIGGQVAHVQLNGGGIALDVDLLGVRRDAGRAHAQRVGTVGQTVESRDRPGVAFKGKVQLLRADLHAVGIGEGHLVGGAGRRRRTALGQRHAQLACQLGNGAARSVFSLQGRSRRLRCVFGSGLRFGSGSLGGTGCVRNLVSRPVIGFGALIRRRLIRLDPSGRGGFRIAFDGVCRDGAQRRRQDDGKRRRQGTVGAFHVRFRFSPAIT